MKVASACAWTDTGVDITAGDAVAVSAQGMIQFREPKTFERPRLNSTGPEGTYLYHDDAADEDFPLPAASGGPAPAYALIGRIGDGPAFFVGRDRSWVAADGGRLYLGVNDFQHADNGGHFLATIALQDSVIPVAVRKQVSVHATHGYPAAGCQAVVFYVDGLRPDVVREMAAMGHLPHINQLFLEGGVSLPNTFTAFPSDTITSNGTMWTGCFSDRHGIKGQVRFSRRTLRSQSYLEPLGPNRSARLLAPIGWDKVGHESASRTVGHVKGDAAEEKFRLSRVTGVPPLFQHLRNHGGDWSTGALPMMTEMPPLLWSRSLVRQMPYFHMHEAWKYIDDANTHFTQWHLLDRETPVTIVWLPETDSVSHTSSRGQFGLTRRTIARADQLIGQVVEQLRETNRLCRTYFFLVSDHGHHGGRNTHLTQFDLANQFFYAPREIASDGRWTGGGLGLSVRQHRSWNQHKGDDSRSFVFVDGDSDGAARVFLPRCHFHSGDWTSPQRPADAFSYRIADHLPPVNLVRSLTAAEAVHGSGYVENPVDLVLVKLDDHSILVSTADRGAAAIERIQDSEGRWRYRYVPVASTTPHADGRVTWTPASDPRVDPLGLLKFYTGDQLAVFHSERTWLKMTAPTRYPDSVVTLTRHMLWQQHLRFREQEYSADIVVTAKPGWYFGTKATKGTTHGYPLADAMRATMFVSGPNVRRGAVIEEPARLADLTPTILQMTGTPYAPSEMDGTAWRLIYEPPQQDAFHDAVTTRAVTWDEVDLNAWHGLHYAEQPRSVHVPLTINNPGCPFDLNIIAYNALSVPDINVPRLIDDVLFPFSGGKLSTGMDRADMYLRRNLCDGCAGVFRVLDAPNSSLGDYSQTSIGNLKRVDRAIDWLQDRGGHHQNMACRVINGTVDTTQAAIWETYRFAQRVVVQVLDETVLNSVENTADRGINYFRRTPAEVPAER